MASQKHIAQELLARAHSPDTAEQLFTERVRQKPLHIRPTSPTLADNRERRRLHRLRKKEYFLRKQKPKPLSAREKRITGVHELPKNEVKYEIFKKLHAMWVEYMQEVLNLKDARGNTVVTPLSHGSKLVSADFHGAELEVVRSTCVSRVGVKGIVVRDSKFVFVLVTEKDKMKTIPKEHTVFRFELPLPDGKDQGVYDNETSKRRNLVFEIHGSQFEVRASDRANKKFKWRAMDYL
ncbi:hypothetical protein VTO42DRAFT_1245 [Malbranchea cinnamomea]